jgi:hypothetical protein
MAFEKRKTRGQTNFKFIIELLETDDKYTIHLESDGDSIEMLKDFGALIVLKPELLLILEKAIEISKLDEKEFKNHVAHINKLINN